MIRGTEQSFKFTTPTDFKDIDRIVAVFSQPHNSGTTTAPMPITKYYDKQLEEVDSWSETGKSTNQTYCVGTKYYWGGSEVSHDTPPTEADILSSNATTTYPLAASCDKSNVYKCEKSYYQYNPEEQNWDITTDAPSTELQSLNDVGVDNIPSDTDKKRACVYNRSYHRYNGNEWETSTTEILPIEEINYWDSSKESGLDTDKTYCALETYYKYVVGTDDSGSWQSYGRPEEVRALNDACDKSKIYMMKELYYQYNIATDQFEKTGVREVYYQYNTTSNKWEECECPCMDAEEIDLWIEADADRNKVYVCKNVYYRYNAGLETPAWEASNNMLVPVIEIDRWVASDYHDISKIYMCPTRYYQYNISKETWEEVDKVVQPQTVKLDYWTDPIDRDKNKIYLCGPTYFQYNSENEKWVSSASFNMKFVKIDELPNGLDESKIYECSPTYYAYVGGVWEDYKNIADAVRNDGFAQVEGDPKSFVIKLTAEETMRFDIKYKGRVQAVIDNISHPMEYFSVYPTLIDEIPDDSADAT
jgi:hypothetical protein